MQKGMQVMVDSQDLLVTKVQRFTIRLLRGVLIIMKDVLFLMTGI